MEYTCAEDKGKDAGAMRSGLRVLALAVCASGLLASQRLRAENCTTQSQMQPEMRDTLTAAAASLAAKVEADDAPGVRALTIAEFKQNFTGIAAAVAATAPKLKGAVPQVDQLYLLDASTLKPGANGVNPDAQFFCTLNKSASEAEFSIPQLPPGRYAFTSVWMDQANPWLLSFLLRQDGGSWLLAGLYPKPLTANGHDGLWYWKQARSYEAQKQSWNAWLYLQEAHLLVQPAVFFSSTHLEKLDTELQAAAPPAVASGVSADAPLVVKAGNGDEFRFTGLTVDNSLGVDVAAHIKVDSIEDVAAARKRNVEAMAALLTAHPELRQAFHGMWVFADAPGKSPYATELSMADIH